MAVDKRIVRIEFEGADRVSGPAKSATASVKDLASVLDNVKSVLAAVGVTVGAGAMVKLAYDTMTATAALDNMAERTGATVERLSAMQRVAKVGGHDFDGFIDQIGKMIKGLKSADEEGQKASQALDYLGIKAKDSTGKFRDPGAIVEDLAAKLSKYADSGNKAALVQDALGKGADRYIPFLKDLAEKTDYLSTITTKQAREAEDAEKNIRRLKEQFADARRELVTYLTPAILDFTEKLLAAKQATGGLPSAAGLVGIDALLGDPKQVDDRVRQIDVVLDRLRQKQQQQREGWSAGSLSSLLSQEVTEFNRASLEAERQFLVTMQRRTADRSAKDPSSPLFEFGGDQTLKDLNYQTQDPRRLKPSDIAKMQAEGMEELKRQDAEMDKYLGERDLRRRDNTLKAIEDQREVTMLAARAMMLGAQDENPEDQHPELARRTAMLQQMRESLKTEEQLEIEAHTARMSNLAIYTDQELEALGGRQKAMEQMEFMHADRLYRIRKQNLDSLGALNRTSWQGQVQTVLGFVQDMTAGVSHHNKLLFEINKIATLANIAVKTPSAIASSYEFGAKIGGPYLGLAMGALAAAAMAAQFAAASATQYGGGGAAPSVGPTAAPPVTPVAAGSQAQIHEQISTTVVLQGRSYDRDQVRELLERINDELRDGAKLAVLTPG